MITALGDKVVVVVAGAGRVVVGGCDTPLVLMLTLSALNFLSATLGSSLTQSSILAHDGCQIP